MGLDPSLELSGQVSFTPRILSRARIGIDTAEVASPLELGFDHPERRGYDPTEYRDFRIIAKHLISAPDVTFIDYGCGLGRSLVLAAMLPFGRMIGIELSPELAQHARENVRNAKVRFRCSDISVAVADASTDCGQDRPQRSNWRGGCIITTEGVRLDARKNGQIASFGTAGTPETLRSPRMASREPRRLLSSTSFQSSSGECRIECSQTHFESQQNEQAGPD